MAAYETTEVMVSKSQEQIRKLIYAHGGKGLSLISRPPYEGFEAMITIDKLDYHVRIMATCKRVEKDKQGYVRSGTALDKARDQEERRVWRVLFYHLKAMFDSSDSGVIDVRDVILPYVVTQDGGTVADHLRPRMAKLMTMEANRLLPAGEGR